MYVAVLPLDSYTILPTQNQVMPYHKLRGIQPIWKGLARVCSAEQALDDHVCYAADGCA